MAPGLLLGLGYCTARGHPDYSRQTPEECGAARRSYGGTLTVAAGSIQVPRCIFSAGGVDSGGLALLQQYWRPRIK